MTLWCRPPNNCDMVLNASKTIADPSAVVFSFPQVFLQISKWRISGNFHDGKMVLLSGTEHVYFKLH